MFATTRSRTAALLGVLCLTVGVLTTAFAAPRESPLRGTVQTTALDSFEGIVSGLGFIEARFMSGLVIWTTGSGAQLATEYRELGSNFVILDIVGGTGRLTGASGEITLTSAGPELIAQVEGTLILGS
jgi:hypothetical protein